MSIKTVQSLSVEQILFSNALPKVLERPFDTVISSSETSYSAGFEVQLHHLKVLPSWAEHLSLQALVGRSLE